jgi:tetratricopeptide (TPR) repeat protein
LWPIILFLTLAAQMTSPGGGLPHPSASRSNPAPVFISGQVFIEDGSSIDSPIAILGGCRGSMHMLGYSDLKGHFTFDLKSSHPIDDAASPSSHSSTICEVSARLEGFRSSSIDLTQRASIDNPEIGAILLHRVGEQEGRTVSITSLQAPKSARRAFDKGMDATRKHRLDEAAAQFEKAVALYPKYADAWYRLGHVQVEKKQTDTGRASFGKAILADGKLVPPYVELAALDVSQDRWQDAVGHAQRAIKLDPFSSPVVYFFDALANYSLKNWNAAEKSARDLQQLDVQHHYIKINRMLAALLTARNNFSEAADQLRDYLKYGNQEAAKDVDEVRGQLAELEKRLAADRR